MGDTAISQAEDQWKEKAPPLEGEETSLKADNTELQDDIDRISAWRSYIIFWPIVAPIRAIKVSNRQKKVDANNERLAEITRERTKLADDSAFRIVSAYMNDHPEKAEEREMLLATVDIAREELALFDEAVQRTNRVLGTISRAKREAEQAVDQEEWSEYGRENRRRRAINDMADGDFDVGDVMDALGGGRRTMSDQWADQETREAVQAFDRVRSELEAYQGYLKANFDKSVNAHLPSETADRLYDNNSGFGGLMNGNFGGILGDSSAQDIRMLQQLMGQLGTVEGQIRAQAESFATLFNQAQERKDMAAGELSSFRKEILRELKDKYNGEFLDTLMANMTRDDSQLRAERSADLQARFG